MKKVFSVLLSLVMLMSLLSVGVAVSAATPDTQVIEAYAGETIKIKFIEDNCYGVSGSIEYSNRNLFSSLTPGGTTSYGKITEKAFILSSFDKVTCEVILTAKIAADAKVGDQCLVSFYDCELVENNEDFSGRSGYTKTVTVKVVKKPTTTTTKKPTTSATTTKPNAPTTKPNTPTTKPNAPTTKKPKTSTTNKSVANLDLTELNKQITIAEALPKSDFTVDSWSRLVSALKAANKARNADTQNEVNKAAQALKEAIAALVRIDRSALEQLIAGVNAFLTDNDLASIWEELHDAMNEAEAALKSGDQAVIDAAYTRLNTAFQALKDKLAELGEDKVVIQDANTNDECAEKCHIWKNTIWHPLLIILLIVSAVLNVGMGALIAWYLIKRKKNTADNTPVVDYDINDD